MVSLLSRLQDDDPTLRKFELNSMKGMKYDEVAKALRSNSSVKSFHICDEIFNIDGFRSPTWKQLRAILQSVSSMNNLEEFELNGTMYIDNEHDVRVIARAVSKHPRLKQVKLHDFVVHANDHEDSEPLLESLAAAAASLQQLEVLSVRCMASYKSWDRSYVTCSALVPLCKSTTLQRLTLSNVGLGDEHLCTISTELGGNPETILEELILNSNQNTSKGIEAIADLLARNFTIERIEVHNHQSVRNSTCELLLENLEKNRVVKYCHMNIPYNFRREIEFYLLLNRAGRKVLLDPDSALEDSVNVLAAANGNVGVLMHLLRDNPNLCRDHSSIIQHDNRDNGHERLPQEKETKSQRGASDGDQNQPSAEKLTDSDNSAIDSTLTWRGFWYRTSTGVSTSCM